MRTNFRKESNEKIGFQKETNMEKHFHLFTGALEHYLRRLWFDTVLWSEHSLRLLINPIFHLICHNGPPVFVNRNQ
jgi:hypothetical protein